MSLVIFHRRAPSGSFERHACEIKSSNRHSVSDPVATKAIDRRFRAAIEQLQPKQWTGIKIELQPRNHADLPIDTIKSDASGLFSGMHQSLT